jgi:hypothetical protein
VSREYKEYYEQKLASLKEEIAAHSGAEEAQAPAPRQTSASQPTMPHLPPALFSHGASPDSDGPSVAAVNNAPEASTSPLEAPAGQPELYNAECTEAEAAKIARFLGISKDAGMSEAITWANSDSPKSRELASFLLADIGTPDATEYLKTLSHDSDNGVAELAGLQLGKGPTPPPTFERMQVEQPLAGSPPK